MIRSNIKPGPPRGPKRKKSRPHVALAAILLMILSGCASVGPDYRPPEDQAPAIWNTELQDGLKNASPDPNLLSQWWTTLGDPVLTELIQRAIAGSLDLKMAKAKLWEARAQRGVSQAAQFPTLDMSGSLKKYRTSEFTGYGVEEMLYSGEFDAGWEIDVFGGVRRSVEAAQAGLEGAQADLEDVLVSLAAETARNYVEFRTYQTRLNVAEANLKAQEETLALTRSRFQAGLTDELPMQQALYNVENTRSKIPTLRAGMKASANRLSVLVGQAPGGVSELLAKDRGIPVPPIEMAVGVPAEALRRRPDIRSAERALAAQTAKVGVAEAELYPKFKLLGTIGLESLESWDFLKQEALFFSVGPSVSWRLFDFGAIRKNIEVRNALQEQALITYEATVLSALEEVENSLSGYAEEQLRRERLLAAVQAAEKAEKIARGLFKAGLVDFNNVLDAQRSLLSFQDDLTVSQGTVTTDLIALYKALGGGWTPLEGTNGPGK
ncbi:MAG: efflux transporter outer membrane subunit [Pseudomonadota bacterium]